MIWRQEPILSWKMTGCFKTENNGAMFCHKEGGRQDADQSSRQEGQGNAFTA